MERTGWCSGAGTEAEVGRPFRLVTCPVCGRAGLGAEDVRTCASRDVGSVPRHRARKLGPDEIPSARFGDQDEELRLLTMQTYEENRKK